MTSILFLAVALTTAPLDAQVHDGRGRAVALSAFQGKPTVLFYEDKDSTEMNKALKEELFRRGKAENLLEAVSVVAVANVAGYNWFPAKGFAQAGIRKASRQFGLPVLADWTGTLRQPPWNLPDKTSTVVVLTPSGTEVLRASGQLGPETSERIFATLRELIPTARSTPPRP